MECQKTGDELALHRIGMQGSKKCLHKKMQFQTTKDPYKEKATHREREVVISII